jgi:hypothetical protein
VFNTCATWRVVSNFGSKISLMDRKNTRGHTFANAQHLEAAPRLAGSRSIIPKMRPRVLDRVDGRGLGKMPQSKLKVGIAV